MDKITSISLKHLNRASNYIKPMRIEYVINGKKKIVDLIRQYDGVSALLFNRSRQVFVLVKQFRPLVYVNSLPKNERLGDLDLERYPISRGVTIEVCSGIIDKKLSKEQVLAEEIFEECGYLVAPSSLEKIVTYRLSPEHSSATHHFYYCELDDSMRIKGPRMEECIDVVEMTTTDAVEFAKQEDLASSPVLVYGFYWFFKNKLKR